jgi:hypothetical protein
MGFLPSQSGCKPESATGGLEMRCPLMRFEDEAAMLAAAEGCSKTEAYSRLRRRKPDLYKDMQEA